MNVKDMLAATPTAFSRAEMARLITAGTTALLCGKITPSELKGLLYGAQVLNSVETARAVEELDQRLRLIEGSQKRAAH